MKKIFCAVLALSMILAGCASELTEEDSQRPKLGPDEILDTETGTVYSLGDSRDVFDAAFYDPSSGIEPFVDGESGNEDVAYFASDMSTVLEVSFKDGKAVVIHCSNRFKSSDFDYSMALEDVKGTFSLDSSSVAELDTYAQYYDVDGNTVEKGNSAFEHFVLVCKSDYGPYKSGDYVGFTLALPYDQSNGNN